ncbi:MAG: cytochrome c maturation protein CcmE [Deltaproteobacteria bacterium]|nr:cytochrome c maturation protein CcmE [Deltaproteobacteria bacterium]
MDEAQGIPRDRRVRNAVAVLLSIVAISGGLALLVVDSLESAQYYKTIVEVHQQAASLQGKQFRVAGLVVPGSLSTNSAGARPAHRFQLGEEGQGPTLVVHFEKPLPDSFTDGVEVVVAGMLLPSGELAASELLARCPSRYEAQRVPEGIAPQGGPAAGGHPTEIPLPAGAGRP